MMELLAMMWKQLTHNTALAFIAVILISGSNSYVAYESSRTNINIESITKAMAEISERSEENSGMIADTQKDMLALQEKLLAKEWEQDKVIADMYRKVLHNSAKVIDNSK